MTTKTKSTRRSKRTAPSRSQRRGESWAESCTRIMAEADAEMAKVDVLIAKMSAEKKTRHYKDWTKRIARLMEKSAGEIRIVDEMLTRMEDSATRHLKIMAPTSPVCQAEYEAHLAHLACHRDGALSEEVN